MSDIPGRVGSRGDSKRIPELCLQVWLEVDSEPQDLTTHVAPAGNRSAPESARDLAGSDPEVSPAWFSNKKAGGRGGAGC